MQSISAEAGPGLDSRKFCDPLVTARGEQRARVRLKVLEILWFNTGTLCNLTCANCYIESSPRNDRLVYLTRSEVRDYLNEIEQGHFSTGRIGFTGGEPFLNPEFPGMLDEVLGRGFEALVLTNAMKPMHKVKPALLALNARYPTRLTLRVSVDHYGPAVHEAERGKRTWKPTLDGLLWLVRNGFDVHIAGRRLSGEPEEVLRRGYARLFAEHAIPIDAGDPVRLMLFPEMDAERDVPEITEQCWGILDRSPDSVMCATSRMVLKRKGGDHPVVSACTLLPYDPRFELGATLAEACHSAVPLNHPHCASFCVLGGAACSRG